jgi:hypothetical protein
MQKNLILYIFNTRSFYYMYLSQGQLLEMQLLESRLLNTFFRNLNCSTEKCHLLDRKKYAVRVPRVNFAVDAQFFATVKYKGSIFFI